MRRREFVRILSAAALWPFAARAQQTPRLQRIGVLIGYAEGDPETKARIAAFRHGLEKRGWFENRNVHIDIRFVDPNVNDHKSLAKELVSSQPDVILAHTTAVADALHRETHVTPIVFVNVSDPIGSGFIANVARPGRNFTGVQQYEAGVVGKWLLMLREIAPKLEHVAVLANPKTSPYEYFLRAAEAAAPSLGFKIVASPVTTVADIKRTIESFAPTPNGSLLVSPDAFTIAHRNLIISLAAHHKLPTVYAFHFFVAEGGLMSYGTDQNDMFRVAAFYVDRILRGDKPADLPVQAPARFETTINLRTAKALGLAVPPGLLVAADEIIE